MEMTYGGALVMPRSYAMMDEEEMMYLEGGAVLTGTAKKLKNDAAFLMATWWSLAGGYTYASAVAAATTIAIPVSCIVATGAAYCAYVATQYTAAYNYFYTKSQTSKTKYKMTTITFLCAITGVECSKA